MKVFQAPTKEGGLAVPYKKTYHHASILATVLPHFLGGPKPQWVATDGNWILPFNLPACYGYLNTQATLIVSAASDYLNSPGLGYLQV
ncbi:Hypothetical predicted protein [Pelobates cultripes]|nr:Hypothetical predicted protein [Pelobates cultripes]